MTDNPLKVWRMWADKLADKVQNKYLQSEVATVEFIQKFSQNQLKKYGKNVKNDLSGHNHQSTRCKACLISYMTKRDTTGTSSSDSHKR